MRRSQPLGLDELMIVNPGPPGMEGVLMDVNGTLYQVQGLGELGQVFLGQDGTLYQVQGCGLNGLGDDAGRFFLGADGTLYEVVR